MLWHCGAYRFDLSTQTVPHVAAPWLMGILNATPDSFSDGGQFSNSDDAIAYALGMVAQGAHIIDVGGESTRPNHSPVPVQDELQRVTGIVQALAAHGVCVSIDSHKPAVMQAALAVGASIVNDVNALHSVGDVGDTAGLSALDVVRDSDCGIVIMDGFSAADQAAKRAGQGLVQRLAARYAAVRAAGIAVNRIVIDPGIGFDKSLEDNLDCIRLLPELNLIAPVLIGGSRKSMLGAITGQPIDARQSASLALALLAAQRGAAVLRVHDVQATADALKVWRAFDTKTNR
jgi:dihydropteroate synthase